MNYKSADVFSLLRQIIAIPSLSGEESELAVFLREWLEDKGFTVHQKSNNLWVESIIDESFPNILFNSHIDTVKAVAGWTRDPFQPDESEKYIYGLGSSDAGGSLVALIFAFLQIHELKDRNFNLKLLISAEEEISGEKGIISVIDLLGKIEFAIVGEPTSLDMAICERGLIVIDCFAHGQAGHAAHKTGENAIMKAARDIEKIKELSFGRSSEYLGEVQVSVTQIEGGYQHNVIPDLCKFVLDVRTNENYTNGEIVKILQDTLESEVIPRSLRLRSSFISPDHPLVTRAKKLGIKTYGSATMSDQALISVPSVKIGPGNSTLSHNADEHIEKDQIIKAIKLYSNLLKDIFK